MSEPQIAVSLRVKIAEVKRYIAGLEERISNARRDIKTLQATVYLLNQGDPGVAPPYMGLRRVFPRGEITSLALDPLQASPDGLDTRQIASAVMVAKGMDLEEEAFRDALMRSIVTMFRRMALRGQVRVVGRQGKKWIRVWAI